MSVSKKALNAILPQTQSDSAWKDILQVWFPEFMAFFYPELFSKIDWSAGYETLDKELQAITTQAMLGKRFVDKLIKVKSLQGNELWVLLHIEIQGEKQAHFEQRLFEYYYRLTDRYHIPIMTLVILADDDPAWRPSVYQASLWEKEVLSFRFNSIKLVDYAHQREMLENTQNPFGMIILAQLAALETRENLETRFQVKLGLTRKLYERGLGRDDILNFYKFLDWVITLPEDLSIRYNDHIHQIEEESAVAYITTAERIGIEKGYEQGMQQGINHEKQLLVRQLTRRFSSVPTQYVNILEHSDPDKLLTIGERILDAQTIDEIFEQDN